MLPLIRPARRTVVAAIASCAAVSALSGCGTHSDAKPPTTKMQAAQQPQVEISISHCGAGWQPVSAGRQQLVLHNTDTRPGEVLLADAQSGAVYSYLEPLAAGSTANLTVDLAAGSYRLRCAMEDADVVNGPVVTITGRSGASTPAVLPVTQAELIGPTKQYEHYVSGQLPTLRTLVDRLRDDLAAGRLANARTDWLPAHLEYERLGAAYGAFGDADAKINGLPDGLTGGIADPAFTGFHRIEYGLWHSQSAATLLPIANALQKSVASLQQLFADAQIDPADVAIRAHEITENAIQFELTGQTNFGSASNLATVAANLHGTAEVLDILKPILQTRYQQLDQLEATLRHAEQVVATVERLPLTALSTAQREMVNASMGDLVELLAPVAEICEPRRTS